MEVLQLSLIDVPIVEKSSWCPDDWETPSSVARAIANLVLPTDRIILEPSAGTGQIAQFLPGVKTICNELNPHRFIFLRKRLWNDDHLCFNHSFPFGDREKSDVLAMLETSDRMPSTVIFPHKPQPSLFSVDLVIGNPPFSLLRAFIEGGLEVLNPKNPAARLIYLLPLDWLCLKSVQRWWSAVDAHIHQVYPIPGRVAYLKNGIPHVGRRRCDAVFDIRLKKSETMQYLEI